MTRTSQPIPLLSRPLAFAYLAILLAIAGAWSNSLGGGPVFDDHWLVVDNPCFGGVERMWALLTLSVENRYCTVRPMRYVSYGVDSALFGLSMHSFHLGNVLRHLVATVLAGLLATLAARRLGAGRLQRAQAPWIGVAVAMLWALHPAQTDSVSYVSGRRDILAGLFTMVAVGCAVVAFGSGASRRRRVWTGLIGVLALAAGLLSKENAAAVPVLAGAWLLLERENAEAGRQRPLRLWTVIVLGVAGAATAWVLWKLLPMSITNRAMGDFWGGSLSAHLGTIAWLQLRYVLQWVGVVPLVGDYHAQTITLPTGVTDVPALAGWCWVAGALATAWLLRRRQPLVALGILWWLIALAPTSQIIPHHELYAEHYLYTPLWGASLVVAALICRLAEAVPRDGLLPVRPALTALAVVVAVAQVFAVADRNRVWRDEQTFYESVWAQAPDNERAMGNLIFIYAGRGEWDKALAPCGRMLSRWQGGTDTQRDALDACMEAARHTRRLDALSMLATHATVGQPEWPRGWRRLAEARLAQRRGGEAAAAARRWWEMTRSAEAVSLALDAARLDGNALAAEWLQWLAEAAGQTPDLAADRLAELVELLRRHGRYGAVLALVEGRPGAIEDAAVRAAYCALVAAQGLYRAGCGDAEGSGAVEPADTSRSSACAAGGCD